MSIIGTVRLSELLHPPTCSDKRVSRHVDWKSMIIKKDKAPRD